MVNINPRGEARGPVRTAGQIVPLTAQDAPVDSSLNSIQFQPPQGLTGVMGLTGLLNTSQGSTGLAALGATGIQGNTGIPGVQGLTGIEGFTGFNGIVGAGRGATGLLGYTGIQGITGISPGDTGIRGLTGASILGGTGAIGNTGIQGITGASRGDTGISGLTGIDGTTGLRGITGALGFGLTGLVGNTGLLGSTGLSGSSIVAIDTDAGLTLLVQVPANTLSVNSQYVQFFGSGFTADTGASTTISLTFGGQIIANFNTGSIADTFTIDGIILRLGAASEEAVASLLFDSGLVVNVRTALTVTLSSTADLILTVSSSGTGHEVAQLTAVANR